MAYREQGMWEILDVLRRLQAGESVRAVARATGRSRKAVRPYAQLAGEHGWTPQGGAEPPGEALACLSVI